jgi:hypothetical protein
MNYTTEETAYITSEYLKNKSRETVDRLAKELGKPVKSIIGKLSREGIYERQVYQTKTGETPKTKAEIVCEIAEKLNADVEKLKGLDKTPKLALKYLQSLIFKV